MKIGRFWKGTLVLLSLLLVALLATSCATTDDNATPAPGKKVTLRLVVPSPAGDELTVKDEEMAGRFNERAAQFGYEIKVYPGGSLAKVPEFLDAVRTGAVELMDAAPAIYGGADPRFNITMLPYLFNDTNAMEAAQADLEAFYDQICREKFNQKVLGHFFVGAFDIETSKKPIVKPEDLQGVLIGCPDPAIIMVADTLGAVPINISWPDFYSSLDKGVVEGVLNSLNGTINNRLTDICKYYTDLQTPLGTNMITVNLDIWNAMPENVRDILMEEAQKTAKETTKLFIERHKPDMEAAKELGVTVHELTPEEREKFKTVLGAYTTQKLAEYGDAGRQIKEIADRANAKIKN